MSAYRPPRLDGMMGASVEQVVDPQLHHLDIVIFGVVTAYSSPWWITRLLAGDPGRKVLMRALRPMYGRGVRSFYLAHCDMDRSTPSSRQKFLFRLDHLGGALAQDGSSSPDRALAGVQHLCGFGLDRPIGRSARTGEAALPHTTPAKFEASLQHSRK